MNYKTLIAIVSTLAVCIVAMTACSGGEVDETTRGNSNKHTTPSTTTVTAPVTTQGTAVSTPAQTTTVKPAAYADSPEIAEDGKIVVDSDVSKLGAFVKADKNGYNVQGLVKSLTPDQIDALSKEEIAALGLIRIYGNMTEGNYKVKGSKIFMNSDAFASFEKMMQEFKTLSGKSDVQVVSAYWNSQTSSETESGCEIKLNAFDEGLTYPLNYMSRKITVNGKSMTYLEWFEENCAKYGFVYIGLSDTENNPLANFRYVGTVNSAYIAENKITLDDYVAKIKSGEIKTVSDAAGDLWDITYVEKSEDDKVIETENGKQYFVFSLGVDKGFMIAVKK